MEAKSIENFDKHFKYALSISKIQFCESSPYFTYEDLRQECYVVYHISKEDDGRAYKSYITTRLVGAIKDYQRKVLKIKRRSPNAPNNLNNVDIDDLSNILETKKEVNCDAEQIAGESLGNGFLTIKEKQLFILYFIEDLKLAEITDIVDFSTVTLSHWKVSLCNKLKNRYL